MTEIPSFTQTYINLADPRLGSEVYFATDDFFADKSRMIDPKPPVFIEDKYDENGKWMDGWESRRKRTAGHDYALIRLGNPASIFGIELDTSHFTGNHAPKASLFACNSNDDDPDETAQWTEVLSETKLYGNRRQFFDIDNHDTVTHLKLNIFPDGGVARMRVYGTIKRDIEDLKKSERIDLAAALNGGRPIAYSDEHFGTVSNMIAPGKGVNMGDGWETARRRDGGHDWAIIALCTPGVIEELLIDTAYFKGNYPASCSIEGILLRDGESEDDLINRETWRTILSQQELTADSEHIFKDEITDTESVSHLRLNIFPDGGVSRLRAFGQVS